MLRMKPWNHLVETADNSLRELQRKAKFPLMVLLEARRGDDAIRDAERVFNDAPTDIHRAAFVQALRRIGDSRADVIEAMGILLAAVKRWNRPSDTELMQVAKAFSPGLIKTLLAANTPNRVNLLLYSGGGELYHRTQTTADGQPQTWRVSGKLKTWKTRPMEFSLPVKFGMYRYGYVTHDNVNQFMFDPDEQ